MKKLKRNVDGITLIALVISIIIMLILAGVSIGFLMGENGILTQSQKAAKNYDIASEREYLEQNVLSVQLDEYIGNVSSEKLGKTLYDRNLENSSIWDIIVEKSENKEYGTGWNYLGKGTILQDYGKTQYNWVVNYETGEIIQLEDESYNNFNYNSTIAVTDGLLFNLDSANVGLDKASWGSNATLYYYDDKTYDIIEKRKQAYEEQRNKDVTNFEGYDRQKSEDVSKYIDKTTGAFNFNGNNYIEIYNENGFDFTNGLTFEFYGNILGNVAATVTKEEGSAWNAWCGLFGLWNGKYDSQCNARFGYYPTILIYSLTSGADAKTQYGEWSLNTSPWNQFKNIGNIFNKDIYFTITIDNIEGDKVNQSIYLYMDGQSYQYTGWLLKTYYEDFIKNAKKLEYLELGRCTYGTASNWGYIKGLCYSTRIYNKALGSDEVQANYDTTTAFHKYIIDSKK